MTALPRMFFLIMLAWFSIPLGIAQNYPTKPIRIVVPFAAGGVTDLLGRTVARKLSADLGQQVVVDNRPGAGGNIGTELVAKSPADGYTLLVVPSSFSINPSLYDKVPYDALKDFEPVSIIASYAMVLMTHPSVPVRSVKEFIALARARPGTLNYASSGTGTAGHLAPELFKYMTGISMTHIPFKGGNPAFASVMAGQVETVFSTMHLGITPHIKGGRLNALGVTSARRSAVLPDVPTIAESGVPGYEMTSWNALFAPKGTSPAIVSRLNTEITKALRSPDMIEILNPQGLEPVGGLPENLGRLISSELPKWAKVIKAAKIRAD